jgi:hypothetical protein
MAEVFSDFLIQRHCRGILDLLANKQLLPAKQQLYSVRELLPHSKRLQKLDGFTDFLLVKNQQS